MLDKYKLMDTDNRWDNKPHFGKSTPGDKSLHKNFNFNQHVKFIESCLDKVMEDLSFNYIEKLKISLMWANVNKTNQWHHGHKHPWSIVSGILYLQGNSGRTWFSRKNPYHISDMFPCYYESEKAEIIHKHNPKPGTMLIFPSDLIHSVDENKEEQDRITMSFNTFPEGEAGNKLNLSGFDLKII